MSGAPMLIKIPGTHPIVDNLSDAKMDDFWKHLKDNNEVYLKDPNGNPIAPYDLPTSIDDLSNDLFRSLDGAVRESCGFEKGDKSSSGDANSGQIGDFK